MAPLSFEEESFSCGSSFDVDTFYSPKKLEQQPQQNACSSSIPAAIETKPLHTEVSKSDDAFLYYSNDKIRVKAMRLQEVPETVRTSDIKQRKTRLSCEADSLAVMEDMMGDMLDDDEEFDMGELVEGFTSADASTSDLLNQLLGI